MPPLENLRAPVDQAPLPLSQVADVVTVNATQGAALGAAILAAVGANAFTSVDEACAQLVRETSRTAPGANASAYPAFAKRYQSMYRTLKDEFAAIARMSTA